MIKTLLFDLDDTLLGNDMGTFLPAYLQKVSEHFAAEILAGAPAGDADRLERLVPELVSAVRAMVANTDPARRLDEVFSDCFSASMGWPPDWWRPRFERFMTERYPELEAVTQPRPAARAVMDWAFGQGYEVVIATSPLFPEAAARQRLRWAGIHDYPYALVTGFAASHFAKPHPEYFAEVLAQLGRRPEQALVVGNDWNNDIVAAAALGTPTFWITGAPEAPAPPTAGNTRIAATLDWVDPQPAGHGSLDDFLAWAPVVLPGLPEAPHAPARALPYLLAGNLAAANQALAGWPERLWTRRPGGAEWSLTEIVCHLRDVEREVNLPRLHAVVEQANPFISGADTDPWAQARDYQSQSGPAALASFTAARKSTLRYLRSQPEDIWTRTARHAIFGPTELREIVGWILDHDRIHLDQVRGTRGRVGV